MGARIKFLVAMMGLGGLTAAAQPLTLDAQAPRVVSAGEAFRVTFVANQNVEEFTPPSISGFSVLAGPAQSTSQSVNIVNGNVTRQLRVSYTYTLYAEREGTFTIGAARVRAGSNTAQSAPLTIECVGKAAQGGGNNQQAKGGEAAAAGSGSPLYLGLDVSKREVYRGESFSAAVKIYARNTAIAGIENPKMPNFNGFWKQDIESPQQINFVRENVNGVVYDVGLLVNHLLFPQQTGSIVINAAELDVITQVRSRSRDIFEEFFGGGVQNVRQSLRSAPVTIRVKDLPSGAPAGFAGAVGNFKIDAAVSAKKITANNGITFTIKISGSGNLELINAPKAAFPPDFEVYDVKSTKNIKNSASGAAGYRQFEYPVIPRSAGEFEIPAVEFAYFNPATAQYHTVRTQAQVLEVEKDARAGDTYISGEPHRSDIKHLAQDIRFINTSAEGWKPQAALFAGSVGFYLCYLWLLLLFGAAYFGLKKYLKDMQNIALVKNRRANKMARRRLAAAAQMLKMGRTQGFYEELLRAMWEYLGNKLNIAAAELSRTSAQAALLERGVQELDVEAFLAVVDECEMARYSRSGGQQAMAHLYDTAAAVIGRLEGWVR